MAHSVLGLVCFFFCNWCVHNFTKISVQPQGNQGSSNALCTMLSWQGNSTLFWDNNCSIHAGKSSQPGSYMLQCVLHLHLPGREFNYPLVGTLVSIVPISYVGVGCVFESDDQPVLSFSLSTGRFQLKELPPVLPSIPIPCRTGADRYSTLKFNFQVPVTTPGRRAPNQTWSVFIFSFCVFRFQKQQHEDLFSFSLSAFLGSRNNNMKTQKDLLSTGDSVLYDSHSRNLSTSRVDPQPNLNWHLFFSFYL